MAYDWIKWVKGLSRRREVLVLARKVNMTRREAACCCMEMWEWVDHETTDGHIRGATRDDIDGLLDVPGFAVALEAQEVGWLVVTDQGLTFPRYERNNGETAKKRALEQRKKRRQRDLGDKKKSRKPRDNCPDENGVPLLFSNLPLILDSSEFRKALENWLKYKIESGKKYKPTGLKSMISHAGKLAEIHGVQAVIDAMERAAANNWQGWDQPSVFAGKNSAPKQRPRSIDSIE